MIIYGLIDVVLSIWPISMEEFTIELFYPNPKVWFVFELNSDDTFDLVLVYITIVVCD